MKVDIKEINKINGALENINGWKVQDFKIWETSSGKQMATIRLTKEDESEEDDFVIIEDPQEAGSMNIGTTVVRREL